MVDWQNALSVAVMGIVSVFLVLGILSVSVSITGRVVSSLNNNAASEQKGRARG